MTLQTPDPPLKSKEDLSFMQESSAAREWSVPSLSETAP